MLGPENKASWDREALVRPRHRPWDVPYSNPSLCCWLSTWATWANASFTATGVLGLLVEGQAVLVVKSGLEQGRGMGDFPSPLGNDVGGSIWTGRRG